MKRKIGQILSRLGLKSVAVRGLNAARVILLPAYIVRDLVWFFGGVITYHKTGSTPLSGSNGMIGLHCRTLGYSHDILHGILALWRRPQALGQTKGVLGDLSPQEVQKIAHEVHQTGFYMFPQRLPEALCNRLEQFALSTPAAPYPRKESDPESALYEREKPLAPTYQFSEQACLDNTDIQKLCADPSFLAVAQAYLKCSPVLDIVTMWWSTTFSREASHKAAQLYHFDMASLKWIKFFVYLTDVGPQNGPHCFVKQSHRSGQPWGLLKHLYARLPDEEMRRYYPPEAFVELLGARGTIFAEDTRGFHKGKPVETGDRLVLEFQFSDSLFGTEREPDKRTRLGVGTDSELLDFARQHKRLFSNFQIVPNADES